MFFVELSCSVSLINDTSKTLIRGLLFSHVELTDAYLSEILHSLVNSSLLPLISSGESLYLANCEFSDVAHDSSFRIIFNIPWSRTSSAIHSESQILSIVRSYFPFRRSYSSIISNNSVSVEVTDFSCSRLSSISIELNPLSPCDTSVYYDSQSRLSIYGFETQLDISRPPYLMFDYTNICNAKCIHCPQSVGFEGQGEKGNLSLEIIKSVLDSVHQSPPEIIRITGDGEPLMNPIFFPSLELISSYNLNSLTAITTNGSLLSKNAIDKLIAFNPLLIDVSLDAYSEEVYSKVRVGLNYETVMHNVLHLISARDSAPNCTTKIIVSFVQQDANAHEVDDFRDYWQSNADQVLIREMISNVGKTSTALSTNTIKRWPCVHWFRRSVVVYDSSVKACPIDWDSKTKVADSCTPSLLPTWQNNIYNEARYNHIFEEIPDSHVCKDCVDWQGTPWNMGYVQFIQDNLT